MISLLFESAIWSRGETEAWNGQDNALLLYEFGPRAEKRLGPWTEKESASLELELKSARAPPLPSPGSNTDKQFWGLISLGVHGQQRTGCQCQTFALQNFPSLVIPRRSSSNEDGMLEEWTEMREREAETCALLIRQAYECHPPSLFEPHSAMHYEAQISIKPTNDSHFLVQASEDEEEELASPPEIPDFVDLVEDEQTNQSTTSQSSLRKRNRLVMSENEEFSDDDDEEQSFFLTGSMSAQALHDFVIIKITRQFIDPCQVLQRKVKDITLENRTTELDKRVTEFLTGLRKRCVIQVQDDFINGFSSRQANPRIPKHMPEGYYKLLRGKSVKESKEGVKDFLKKANALFAKVLEVEIVKATEEAEEEEEDEDGEYSEREEKEFPPRAKRSSSSRQAQTRRRSSSSANAAGSKTASTINREGEAIEVTARGRRRQNTSAAHSAPSIRRRLDSDDDDSGGGEKGEKRAVRARQQPRPRARTDEEPASVATAGGEDSHQARDLSALDLAPKQRRQQQRQYEKVSSAPRKQSIVRASFALPHMQQQQQKRQRFWYDDVYISYMELPNGTENPFHFEQGRQHPVATTSSMAVATHPSIARIAARNALLSAQDDVQRPDKPSVFLPKTQAASSSSLKQTVEMEAESAPALPKPSSSILPLKRRIASSKGLDELLYDFISSGDGDLQVWGDLIELLPPTSDFYIRPLVEFIKDLESSTKRCIFLQTLSQLVVHQAPAATRAMLSFFLAYDYLEFLYLEQDYNARRDESCIASSLNDWGAGHWSAINAAQEVLKFSRTRHDIFTTSLDAWEASRNTFPDLGQLPEFLLASTPTVALKRKSLVRWFEFCWETIGRLAPSFGGDNWSWIMRSLLPSLPCWFPGKASAVVADATERAKWERVLRRSWDEQADGGDYIVLVILRIIELNQVRWTRTRSSLSPLLLRACLERVCRNGNCNLRPLANLIKIELASSVRMRICNELLNVINNYQGEENCKGAALNVLADIISCFDEKEADLDTNKLVAKFVALGNGHALQDVAPPLARISGRSFPSALLLHGLLPGLFQAAQSADEYISVLHAASPMLVQMELRNQEDERLLLDLGGKAIAWGRAAYFALVNTVLCHFVHLPAHCNVAGLDWSQRVLAAGAAAEEEGVLIAKYMDLQQCLQKTRFTLEMYTRLLCGALPRLAQEGFLGGGDGEGEDEAQRAMDFGAQVSAVMLAKGHAWQTLTLLNELQGWGFVDELAAKFMRFQIGLANTCQALGWTTLPPGY